MQGLETLPDVLASIGSSLSQVPPQLAPSVNLSTIAQQLALLSTDVEQTATLLAPAQQELLLSNATWVAENLEHLSGFLGMIPTQLVVGMPSSQIVELLVIGSAKYDVSTAWSPDAFAVILLFGFAFTYKFATMLLLTPRAMRRCARLREREDGVSMMPEVAKGLLIRPVRSLIAHTLNCIVATACLVLQLCAWRLLKIPSIETRAEDVQLLLAAIKLLLIGYASELLSAEPNWEIFVHHLCTFLLLIMGEFSAFYTQCPLFFRFAAWLLLQATAEQTTYISMACYHYSAFLQRQDASAPLRRRCLWLAWLFMEITKYTCYLQKLVPAALSLYWLGVSWDILKESIWGSFFLSWALFILILLIPLQIKFCDDMFSLASYFRTKLDGTKPTAADRLGPVMRLIRSSFSRAPRSPRPSARNTSSAQTPSASKEQLHLGAAQDLEAGRPVSTAPSEISDAAAGGYWTYQRHRKSMLPYSPQLSSVPGYFGTDEPGAARFYRNAFMQSGLFLPEEPQHFFAPFKREPPRKAPSGILRRASIASSRALEIVTGRKRDEPVRRGTRSDSGLSLPLPEPKEEEVEKLEIEQEEGAEPGSSVDSLERPNGQK